MIAHPAGSLFPQRAVRQLLGLVVAAGVMLGGLSVAMAAPSSQQAAQTQAGQERAFDDLARIVGALAEGVSPRVDLPKMLAPDGAAVYLAFRRQGLRLGDVWAEAPTALEALRRAMEQIRESTAEAPDTVELAFAYEFRPVAFAERARVLTNLQRGIAGVELRFGDAVERVGPTRMIATNRSFQRVIDRFASARGLAEGDLSRGLRLRRFAARQYLVFLGPEPSAVALHRGNQVVRREDVTKSAVAGLARRMSSWLARQVKRDGRMTYKYWPSNGRESRSNNMIRQWMATLALVRVGEHYRDADIMALAARNIRYNLAAFYRETDGLGAIEYRDKAKLGAIAIAALALAEHPDRSDFTDVEAALRRSVEHLWANDGSFRTFLMPENRNDNQNFYPGEALLYLASLYRESGDPALLARMMTSVEYYRAWHLAARDPAFVPWHTMAYAEIWRRTRDPGLRDWIFEMNDWLLDMQQASLDPPDIDGRFYDPRRSHFGPPHASATGVYLESLIQAFRVARDTGDLARAEAYRRAIVGGLRSLLQLEFKDPVDMYYVSKRDRVRGGLRTTVYNNEIRVDNVQHGLMAMLEILTAFSDGDYR